MTNSELQTLLKNLYSEYAAFEYRLRIDDPQEPMHVFCAHLAPERRRICILCYERPDQSGELSVEVGFGTYIDGSDLIALDNITVEYLDSVVVERAIRRFFTVGRDQPRKVRRIMESHTWSIPIIRG